MSNEPRDRQFDGFADLLWQEIAARINELDDECNKTEEVVDGCVMCNLKPERIANAIKPIIARRAGEFAAHVATFLPEREMHMMRLGMLSPRQVVDHIPDMTELPEEQEG